MIELDPSKIANAIVIMAIGAIATWLWTSIRKLQKDMNACFNKLRGKDDDEKI